jgi:hypothetical protein
MSDRACARLSIQVVRRSRSIEAVDPGRVVQALAIHAARAWIAVDHVVLQRVFNFRADEPVRMSEEAREKP